MDEVTGQPLVEGQLKDGLYTLYPSQDNPPYTKSSKVQSVNCVSATSQSRQPSLSQCFSTVRTNFCKWHQRLGHPSSKVVTQLIHVLPGCNTKMNKAEFCSSCAYGKSHVQPFKLAETKTTHPLHLIHSDLWGPSPILSKSGYRYYVTFLDDYTRYTWIFPLRTKDETLSVFQNFQKQVEKYFCQSIKLFQSDWGGEYRPFSKLLLSKGILHRKPCPHIHQQNGRIERKHRHIVESGLTLLAQAAMPLHFWWEAFLTATYLLNRMPTPVLKGKSPFQCLFNSTPDYTFLRVFGCACYPHLRPYNSQKLQFRSTKCLFIGYSPEHKGYCCLHPSGRTYITRNCLFDENEFPYSTLFPESTNSSTDGFEYNNGFTYTPFVYESIVNSRVNSEPTPAAAPSTQHPTPAVPLQTQQCHDNHASARPIPAAIMAHIPTVTTSDSSPTAAHSNESLPTVSTAVSNDSTQPTAMANVVPAAGVVSGAPTAATTAAVPSHYRPAAASIHGMQTRVKSGIIKPRVLAATKHPFVVNRGKSEPTSVAQALLDPKWNSAMNKEFRALVRNHTWDLVPPDSLYNVVGNKWVFKEKLNADGTVQRQKARLVAKGFHQTPGLDFSETYSPVIKPATVRIFIAVAVHFGWDIQQLDVDNAFLNGILKETVYMTQPEGFVDPQYPHYVCHLKKALYGLKQAPRAWFERLNTSLLQWGFTPSKADVSLFIYHKNSQLIFLLVYVDDILVTGSHLSLISKLVADLNHTFALKQLGSLHYFLGIEAYRDSTGIYLSQSKYVADLLNRLKLTGTKPCSTPAAPRQTLSRSEGEPMDDPSLYRSTIGALQYLTLTRPDIAYIVSKLSQFLHCPTTTHWQACKRVLKYLKGTATHGVSFKRGSSRTLALQGFSDADWASCPDDRRSTGAYCVYLGSSLVSWSSKKQTVVARSSTESEYRALAHVTAEIMWLKALIQEMHIPVHNTPIIWCDNLGAASLAANPVHHARTKHIEIDVHFVRDMVLQKLIDIRYVPTLEQIADVLTKGVSVARFLRFKDKLQVVDSPFRLRGNVEKPLETSSEGESCSRVS
ncbi:retrovirus-related Pol polyprotein from transposon RE1 isoform X2 [Cannabis sativa]|uniref:retrovirus-related Pol polyprotein from transposon RE1 isoform X2 n=1 Tax=Cannabis sativa TaxID=3483 RepID=UPI0029CA348C|nr:retrovirus-related Pol polyprotein from transposon RE1 isoform X2 [Cannabis sativa]